MAWKEPIPPAGNKQVYIQSYIQTFDNNLVKFLPKMSKERLQFWIFVKEFKTVYHQITTTKNTQIHRLQMKKSKSAKILSPLWAQNSTLYFMPTKTPPVHKSGKLLMECHGVRCRAERYSPGVKVMPHHHVQGMNEWWNTCRNVIWPCFFLSTKNTSNKKADQPLEFVKTKKMRKKWNVHRRGKRSYCVEEFDVLWKIKQPSRSDHLWERKKEKREV